MRRTWADVIRFFMPSVTDDWIEHVLWSFTAFPFGDVRLVVRQIHRHARCTAKKIPQCMTCGRGTSDLHHDLCKRCNEVLSGRDHAS